MSNAHAAQEAASEATAAAEAQGAGGDPELEARARRMGWRPKEEFRGPADRWSDAETYVQKAETEHPILLERYRVLDGRFEKLERSNQELQSKTVEQTQVLREFAEHNKKIEKLAYDRAVRELKDRQTTAVAHADTETFKATQAELERLEEARPAPAKPNGPVTETRQQPSQQVQPEVIAWVKENPWFDRDPEARAFATALHGDLLVRAPNLSLSDNLAEVSSKVRKRFSELFEAPKPAAENPARNGAPSVAMPAPAPAPKRVDKHSYEHLPADAKKACDKFVKQIPGFTRETYCQQYDWS